MFTRYGLPLIAALAMSFAVLQMTKAQQKPPPASPPVDPGKAPFVDRVSGAGIVEPEAENISVGSPLPGIVTTVNVAVGDVVKVGTVLFELDDRQLRAERAYREANLKSARSQLSKLEMMPRTEELPPLEAKVTEARALVRDKTALYERIKKITGNVSEEEMVSRQMAVEMAKAQLAKSESDLALMRAGSWLPDKLVAEAAVEQARAQLAMTDTELERLKVAAPRMRKPGSRPRASSPADDDTAEFKVLQVNVRPGEYVGTTAGQALIVLGAVGKLHVRVDIDDNDIGRFRRDMPGVASPRGNPERRYPITFVRVDPFVIPKKSLTGGNTERVDTRVLQVIYAIDAADPGLYVGQQLDVSLNAGGKTGAP